MSHQAALYRTNTLHYTLSLWLTCTTAAATTLSHLYSIRPFPHSLAHSIAAVISCHTVIFRTTLYQILPGNLISHFQAWSSPFTRSSQRVDPSPLQGIPQKVPYLHLFRHRGHRPSRYDTTYRNTFDLLLSCPSSKLELTLSLLYTISPLEAQPMSK